MECVEKGGGNRRPAHRWCPSPGDSEIASPGEGGGGGGRPAIGRPAAASSPSVSRRTAGAPERIRGPGGGRRQVAGGRCRPSGSGGGGGARAPPPPRKAPGSGPWAAAGGGGGEGGARAKSRRTAGNHSSDGPDRGVWGQRDFMLFRGGGEIPAATGSFSLALSVFFFFPPSSLFPPGDLAMFSPLSLPLSLSLPLLPVRDQGLLHPQGGPQGAGQVQGHGPGEVRVQRLQVVRWHDRREGQDRCARQGREVDDGRRFHDEDPL